jgi:hypothetical protein
VFITSPLTMDHPSLQSWINAFLGYIALLGASSVDCPYLGLKKKKDRRRDSGAKKGLVMGSTVISAGYIRNWDGITV